MFDDGVPYLQAYPLVSPMRFTATNQGYRTHEETIDFLGLSKIGFGAFQRSRSNPSYGPKWTSKSKDNIPAWVFRDEDIAKWILKMGMLEMSKLGYYQHVYPSASNKIEAAVSTSYLRQAVRVIKK